MLRRPADQYLTLLQIADDWSREIQPPRSKHELTNELGKAWWRGEFVATRGPTRLAVLQSCFRNRHADLLFWLKGACEPQTVWEQSDGGAVVLLTPVLPVPNAVPESWSDDDCGAAYDVIVEGWGSDEFRMMEPFVTIPIHLSETDFTKWIGQVGHTRPDFWVAAPSSAAEHVSDPSDLIPKNVSPKTDEFVRQYIADMQAAKKLPTKSGLEQAAKEMGRKGNRELLRKSFNLQMDGDAPVRGRPPK